LEDALEKHDQIYAFLYPQPRVNEEAVMARDT
jgi:hypothetical protein